MCGDAIETTEHLLLHCLVVGQAWHASPLRVVILCQQKDLLVQVLEPTLLGKISGLHQRETAST